MARKVNRLSARAVSTIAKPGRHADGNGLYLSISENGGRRWVFLYRRGGKLKEKGLGSASVVSLADARTKAEAIRKQLQNGLDPIAEGKKSSGVLTFSQCAEAFIAANEAGWRNAKHKQQWRNTLKTYADPAIGSMPINQIVVSDIMRIVAPLWSIKNETASRLRGRIESVLDWAAALNYRSSENPARWRGHLDKLLPSSRKVRRVQHHPALPYVQVSAFMSMLRERTGTAARALEFGILCAARTGDIIGSNRDEKPPMRWEHVDLEACVWTIPSTKTDTEHSVPLPDAAVRLLRDLDVNGDIVFPGQKPDKPLSNMSMAKVIERINDSRQRSGLARFTDPKQSSRDVTVHGFRSTFRDWAAETTDFPNEIVEMALAHTIENKVEAAYRRGNMLQRRRALMAAWEAYCARAHEAASVTPIRAGGLQTQ